MGLLGSFVALLVVVAGIVSAGLAVAAWWNRHQPGIDWFGVHVGLLSIWSFVGFLSFVAETKPLTRSLGLVASGVSLAVTLAWFVFIVEYLGHSNRPGRWAGGLFVFLPGSIYFLLNTAYPGTKLAIQKVGTTRWSSYLVMNTKPAPLGALVLMFGFGLFFVGIVLLLREMVTGQLHWIHGALLLVGSVIPVGTGLFLGFPVLPDGLPLVQVASALSVSLYTLGFRRYDLFRFSPATERIGVNRAFEELGASVLVTETDGRVITVNDSCCRFFGTDRRELVGTDLSGLLGDLDLTLADLPATVERDNQYYRVVTSPVTDGGSQQIGNTVLLLDITNQRLREQRLDVLNRVLRHNLRNDMQLITASTQELAEQLDGTHGEKARQAYETASDLVSTSNKARTVQQLIGQTQEPAVCNLCELIQEILDRKRSEFSQVSFTFESPEECVVSVSSGLELTLKEIIENAAEHNDADTPTVEVTLTEKADTVTVTVSDNGPGISAHELAVIDEGKETELQHGSGMGLWMIQWALGNTAVEVEFERTKDGTDVRIEIPRSEQRRNR